MHRNINMFIGYCWRRYIPFLFINIGIIIFVCVVLKKIKITLFLFTGIVSKITKEYSPNSSSSSYVNDYVNIVEITSTQYYTRIEYVRKLYNRNTEYRNYVDSTWSDMKKSTWRTHRYFVDFESGIEVEISTLNRCHNFHMD